VSVKLAAMGRHQLVESSGVAGTCTRQALGLGNKVGRRGHGAFWRNRQQSLRSRPAGKRLK
jgi:hypothetical protein